MPFVQGQFFLLFIFFQELNGEMEKKERKRVKLLWEIFINSGNNSSVNKGFGNSRSQALRTPAITLISFHSSTSTRFGRPNEKCY